jgi:hypothetical protein
VYERPVPFSPQETVAIRKILSWDSTQLPYGTGATRKHLRHFQRALQFFPPDEPLFLYTLIFSLPILCLSFRFVPSILWLACTNQGIIQMALKMIFSQKGNNIYLYQYFQLIFLYKGSKSKVAHHYTRFVFFQLYHCLLIGTFTCNTSRDNWYSYSKLYHIITGFFFPFSLRFVFMMNHKLLK